jgi:inhibitor of cysteine peptidase
MIVALLISACSATGDTGEIVVGMAPVDTVDVMMLQSLPTQIQVVATGVLPDACTEIGETTVQQDGNRFEIEMLTHSNLFQDQACAQVVAPYEETIPLDVAGLAAGEYVVEVNGVTDSFTLDNIRSPDEPTTTEMTWVEARQLILNGQVSEVTQLHSLEVRLLLRDGNIVVTTEPEIDEVFRVLDECGLPCSDVLVATE